MLCGQRFTPGQKVILIARRMELDEAFACRKYMKRCLRLMYTWRAAQHYEL